MVFSVYTLGCKLNQLETEAITDSFCREGFSFIPWESASTETAVMVINTCTVTSMAEQKARRLIRKAIKEHPGACFIVTGCYAQMEEAALAALGEDSPGRFFVIPGNKKDRILDLPRFLAEARCRAAGTEEEALAASALPGRISSWFTINFLEQAENGKDMEEKAFRFRPENFASHSRAFLKIQDGCDKQCAYCRVSLARGKSRSLGVKEVLAELSALEQRAFAELVLTGVNISQYSDSGMRLPGLLDFLLKGSKTIRLRLSSIEPDGFTEEFFRVLTNKRIRPHFHLSLQSGSAKVLERMGRSYTPGDIEKIVMQLREVREDPFLACDIIAGFPGETDEEFEKTYRFCEKTGFSWIHVFPFSPRPGTAAYNFPQKITERDTARRVDLLRNLAARGRRDYIGRWVDKEVEAIVEAGERLPNGFAQGVSENYLKIYINCENEPLPLPGSLVRCRIIGNQEGKRRPANPAEVKGHSLLSERVGAMLLPNSTSSP